MLVMLMSQPRVFWTMAKDGLLPPVFARIHPRFRAPLGWFTPVMGALICLAQMAGLPGRTWLGLLGWLAIGLVIYFLYGMKRSKLAGVRRAG